MFGFDMFSGMFSLVFIFIIGVFIFTIVKGISEWSSNNRQPIVPVDSKITSKRMSVTHHNHGENGMSHNSTSYYVTFEFENSERLELKVSGSDYGLMSEGDRGVLSFQGTRFISFKRS
ncbi:DUF2500 family protein [Clostridium tertium]|uniref:DUF2500 domain-containing protein n=1 Tax=Clostridium tertium TaxID=1559 RepID=A0A6N3EWV4_9CLOT